MTSHVAHNVPDLGTVVIDVLGDLAFMVTDDDRPEVPPGTVGMQAEIFYRGPLQGRLRCWTTRTFAARLAANLLGIEPTQAEAEVAAEDAVRELANVLCGQLVTTWYGKDAVFKLSIPAVRECLVDPAALAADPPHGCRVSIEGEPLLCIHEREPDPT